MHLRSRALWLALLVAIFTFILAPAQRGPMPALAIAARRPALAGGAPALLGGTPLQTNPSEKTLGVPRATAKSRARAPVPARELSLAGALALMPDTAALRSAGIWYNDYALAARAYGVSGTVAITAATIADYFRAIQPLRPGPETGVAGLARGQWRQTYGYDLFQMTGDIYSRSGGFAECNKPPGAPGAGSTYPLAVAAGDLDAPSIDRALAADNYLITHTGAGVGALSLYVRTPVLLNVDARGSIMNAVLPGARQTIFGARPCDVGRAAQLVAPGGGGGAPTLGQDGRYVALAAALGPVQAAYVAANVAPPPFALPPFPAPPGGHRGPALHAFGLYAVAYAEPRRGERYVLLALDYARRADALADVPTLQARLQQETLSIYGAPWRQLVTLGPTSLTVRGTVLLARLRLRPATPPTLWQDVVAEHALSLLSR